MRCDGVFGRLGALACGLGARDFAPKDLVTRRGLREIGGLSHFCGGSVDKSLWRITLSLVPRRGRGKKSDVKIKRVESGLSHRYHGQNAPQPVYVYLDCRHGVLSADYDPEIGGAVGADVYHGHTLRWRIPAMPRTAANTLLSRLAPLAEKVLAGYESVWDGNNHVGRFTPAAHEASAEIGLICDELRASFIAHGKVRS